MSAPTRLYVQPVAGELPKGLAVGDCAGPARCDVHHYARHRQQLAGMSRRALLAVLGAALDRVVALEQAQEVGK